ncbi:MAG: dihydrolipoyl dehydrogenase [Muribaculaceae bacterium]|nr:dihydrolipoyl dehydrogenase [Muribaculaceae bacterium]
MFDIIIIGAGPGGYEMAASAAAHGLTVGIVERDLLGGTCLNRGCIPTKALCRNAEVVNLMRDAVAWGITASELSVDYTTAFNRKNEVVTQLRDGVAMLMKQPGITVIEGEARLVDAHAIEVAGTRHEAKHIVVATGSAPRGLPIPGADLCMTSDDVLAMDTLPRSLCIVGGGVIGMEFAAIFQSFGLEVTVIEYCKEILPPFDKDIAKRLKTVLTKRGIKIITGAAVKAVAQCDQGLTVTYDAKGKEQSITAERVLMSVGRQPVLPQGLDTVGVIVSRRGIEVDDHMRTNVESIYAIGDVNGRMMLAHAASAQGEVALAHILGKPCSIRLDVVPSAVFTVPELSMVGLTEEQCAERGMNVVVKKSFFRSNGKAISMGEPDGLLKMIVDADTRKIVGCHICGAHAADLIQEVVMAMNADATIDCLSASIHGHPTLTEVVLAAARQF